VRSDGVFGGPDSADRRGLGGGIVAGDARESGRSHSSISVRIGWGWSAIRKFAANGGSGNGGGYAATGTPYGN
jgi:hypothetical protein